MYTIGFREISPGVAAEHGIAADIQPPLDLDPESVTRYLASENFDEEEWPANLAFQSVNLLGSTTGKTVVYADVIGGDEMFIRMAKQDLGKRITGYLNLMGEESQIVE